METMTRLKTPSETYWERRSAMRMQHYQRDAQQTIDRVQAAYDSAQRQITQSVQELFDRYANRYGLDPAQARAILNERLTPQQHAELKRQLSTLTGRTRQLVAARLNVESFAYRISTLESLRTTVDVVCAELAEIETVATTDRMIKTAADAYDRVEYDLQSGMRVGWNTSGISRRQVRQLLREDWSGKHYSERIWTDTRQMAQKLNASILEGLLAGRGYANIADTISLTFDTGRMEAARLVMTETSYIANAAELERYQDEGINRYLYIAVLDIKTSDICAEHDGKTYPVSEAKIGKNFPPLHPWCRSTTGPALSDEWVATLEYAVTDPETGKVERIPVSKGYEWWREHFRKPAEPEPKKRKQPTAKKPTPKFTSYTKYNDDGVTITMSGPVEMPYQIPKR